MTPRRASAFALALLGAWLCAAGPARADDAAREEAKRHFASGESLFKGGDYRAAILEFKAADALVPSPILSFNIGLCHEKLGEEEAAVSLYRTYLARRPDAPNREQVEARIGRLEQQAAARRAPPPAPAPVPAPTPGHSPDLYEDPPPAPTAPSPAPGGMFNLSPAPAASSPAPGGDPLAARIPARAPGAAPAPGGSYAAGGAAPAPAPSPQSPEKPAPKKARPVYKEWWFWVVVGVSAYILVDIARDDSGSSGPQSVQNGAVLLRF